MVNTNKKRWWDFGIESCVFLILGILPLVFWPGLALPFEIPKILVFRSLVYLGSLFFLCKVLFDKFLVLPSVLGSRLFKLVVLSVGLILILSTLFSVSPSMSFWGSSFRHQGFVSFLHYFVFFLLLLLNFKALDFRRSFYFVFGGLALVLLYGLAQSFGIYFGGLNVDEFLGRVFSSLGHPNYFGSYILILFFPLVAFCFTFYKERRWELMASSSLLILLSLINLALTQNRGAFVGLLAGLVVGLVMMTKKKFVYLTTFLVIAVVLILGGDLFSRFSLESDNLRSLNTRFIMWETAPDIVLDKPVFGHGPDTFSLAYGPYMNKEILLLEDFKSIPDRIHNNILQIFVDFGLVGGSVLLFLVGWLFVLGVRKTIHGRLDDERRRLAVSCLASGVGVFIAHLFGFSVTVHFVYLSFLTAFFLSLLSKKTFVLSHKKMITPVLVSVFVLSLFWPHNFSILNTPLGMDHDGLRHLSLGKALAEQSVAEHSPLAEKEFEHALEFLPVYPDIYFERGKLYFSQGKMAEAVKDFEFYLELSPPYWKDPSDRENYRLFYKANPSFSEVFGYLVTAYKILMDKEKSAYFSQF